MIQYVMYASSLSEVPPQLLAEIKRRIEVAERDLGAAKSHQRRSAVSARIAELCDLRHFFENLVIEPKKEA